MRKNTRGLVLLVLAYIAFFPIEFSVAQDPPRANNLGGQGGVRVFRKRESPVLFSQQGEVRFQKAYVDQNGSIRADGRNLDLFGAVLIRRDRICTSGQGARWTLLPRLSPPLGFASPGFFSVPPGLAPTCRSP